MKLNFDKLREEMVLTQIIERGVRDKATIEAFRKVPREEFLPEDKKELAYFDGPVEIGFCQTISQPFIVALMVSELEPVECLKCLEIGTGSGYETAILLSVGLRVYSVERFKELALFAEKNLEKLNYRGFKIIVKDGTLGLPEYAPFDRIIVSAGAPKIPECLIAQLSKNHGIMIIPVGDRFTQSLLKIIKKRETIEEKSLDYVRFVPLVGKEGWKGEF